MMSDTGVRLPSAPLYMNRKSWLLTLGGILFTSLTRKRTKTPDVISDATRERVLADINSGWMHEPVKSTDHPQAPYPIMDSPTKFIGGKINLIRAVADGAESVIKDIDRELHELEDRKNVLIIEKLAHEEMLAVAERYVEKTTVTITSTRSTDAAN